MPVSRNFVVTETRRVGVQANTPTEAIQIAQMAFQHGQEGIYVTSNLPPEIKEKASKIQGNTSDKIRVTELVVQED